MNARHDIGKILQRAREERGLAVADVAHRTRIPGKIVEALEANDYSPFPGPAYAKSFLHQYSEFLEVDAHEWLEAFAPADPLAHLETYEYLQPHDEHVLRRPIEPQERPEETATVAGAGRNFGLQTLVIFAITFALIGAAVYAVQAIESRLAPAVAEQAPVTEEAADERSMPETSHREKEVDSPAFRLAAASSPGAEAGEETVADTSVPRAIIVDP